MALRAPAFAHDEIEEAAACLGLMVVPCSGLAPRDLDRDRSVGAESKLRLARETLVRLAEQSAGDLVGVTDEVGGVQGSSPVPLPYRFRLISALVSSGHDQSVEIKGKGC